MPTGRRRAALLGEGDYQTPGPSILARLLFLQLIQQLAPEAVAALEHDNDARAWSQRFGLERCSWFVDVADATLAMWGRQPATRHYSVWGADGLAGRLVPEPADIPAWDIEGETEAQFDARIEAHKAETIEAATARGLVPTPELRNRLHLEWLVRRLIQQWSIGNIAEGYQTGAQTYDNSTIQRGINAAADLVGIPRPPHRKPQ